MRPLKLKSKVPCIHARGSSSELLPPSSAACATCGTAGERQPEEAAHLVERLAGSVVARAAEPLVRAMDAHQHEVRVPAGDDEAERGELRLRPFDEPVRVDVAFEVVDAEERQFASKGDRLGGVEAHQQRSCEARPARPRDSIDVVQCAARSFERFAHDGRDVAEMLAARDLRDHAAVLRVECYLARHHGRARHPPIDHHRRRRLITRGLNCKNIHNPSLPQTTPHTQHQLAVPCARFDHATIPIPDHQPPPSPSAVGEGRGEGPQLPRALNPPHETAPAFHNPRHPGSPYYLPLPPQWERAGVRERSRASPPSSRNQSHRRTTIPIPDHQPPPSPSAVGEGRGEGGSRHSTNTRTRNHTAAQPSSSRITNHLPLPPQWERAVRERPAAATSTQTPAHKSHRRSPSQPPSRDHQPPPSPSAVGEGRGEGRSRRQHQPTNHTERSPSHPRPGSPTTSLSLRSGRGPG